MFTIGLFCILSSPSYRYSILQQGDGTDGDMENALHNNTSLYDDDEADVSVRNAIFLNTK